MRLGILTFILLIISFSGRSGVFPLDSAEWSMSYTDFNLPPNGGYITITHHFSTGGDTFINSFSYSMLYQDTSSEDSFYKHTNAVLIGFVREEAGGKVYFMDTVNNENLVFDFSLEKGDTFSPLSPNGIVTSVDSVFIGGEYRKHVKIDPGLTLWPLEFIEGIGYLKGQGVLSGWNYFNIGIHKSFELLCVKEKGNLIYNKGVCYKNESTLPTGNAKQNKPDVGVMVYPNPAYGDLTLEISRVYEKASITIFDIKGKVIKSLDVCNTQIISLSLDQPAGIYILRIETAKWSELVRINKN